jgi:hypothetical protein
MLTVADGKLQKRVSPESITDSISEIDYNFGLATRLVANVAVMR